MSEDAPEPVDKAENAAWIRVDLPNGNQIKFFIPEEGGHGGLVVLKAMYDSLHRLDPGYSAEELYELMGEELGIEDGDG